MPLPVDPAVFGEENLRAFLASKGLEVTDAEQVQFLQRLDSFDTQASPGCGKTTLTGAKLCVLASSWSSSSQGVAILSHTNVAKDQIVDLLQNDVHGRSFLTYPHFIGTIQGFIHSFIAMPYLRSKGIEIQSVDDFVYSRRALRELRKGSYPTLRSLAARRTDIEPLVTTSFYSHENNLMVVRGKVQNRVTDFPFGGNTPSALEFKNLKKELGRKGFFCYSDMFAFANKALNDYPNLADSLRYRFPFLIMDEMQDTSVMQESLLSSIFKDDSCVVQRIGDINQRIFEDDEAQSDGVLQFPVQEHLVLPRSMRFGSSIAVAATPLTVESRVTLLGNEARGGPPPVLILFTDNTVENVIPRFAVEVAESVPEQEIKRYPVKAVGARKQGGAAKFPRDIKTYYALFDPNPRLTKRPETLIKAVESARQTRDMSSRADAVEVLWVALTELLDLWGAKVGNHRPSVGRLRKAVEEAPEEIGLRVRGAIRAILMETFETEYEWNSLAQETAASLKALFELPYIEGEAKGYLAYEPLTPLDVEQELGNAEVWTIPVDGKSIEVELSTIHAAKGETHSATLILECFTKIHDLLDIVPMILGTANANRVKTTLGIKPAAKRIFVAMTQPRYLLGFAVLKSHVKPEDIQAWSGKGWKVIDLALGQ